MSTIAKWRTKKWVVNKKQIVDLKGLTYSFAQLAQTNDSTEGKGMTNKKGLDLFKMSFQSSLHSGAGVDVRKEINEWKKLVTKTGQFYLNGKKLGPKVRLDRVDISNIKNDNKGRLLYADIKFSFIEYEKEKQKSKATDSSAISVTASSSDKEELKRDSLTINAESKGIAPGDYVRSTAKYDLDGNPVSTDKEAKVQSIKGSIAYVSSGSSSIKLQMSRVTLA